MCGYAFPLSCAMKTLVSLSKEINIDKNPIVKVCEAQVMNYERALSFIKAVGSVPALMDLTMKDISEGIEAIRIFDGIISSAHRAISTAEDWKASVEGVGCLSP